MKPPKILKPYVLSFCRQISNENPITVPLRPLPKQQILDCFNIVANHLIFHGGRRRIGWSVWEWPKVFIEAEFHAIWESPKGELIDLTPRENYFDNTILFLPDPTKEYQNIKVNNRRQPLSKDKEIKEYLALFNEKFHIENRWETMDDSSRKIADKWLREFQNKGFQLYEKIAKKYGLNP